MRPSKTRAGAFEIDPKAAVRLEEQLQINRIFGSKDVILTVVHGLMIASFLVVLACIAYAWSTRNASIRDLSFKEFQDRIGFESTNVTTAARAKYFLYFITKVAQLRNDMTAADIADRLSDNGYTNVTAAAIVQGFSSDGEVRESLTRTNAYEINPRVLAQYEERLLVRPPKESLTMQWLLHRVLPGGWIAAVVCLSGLLAGAFGMGYKLAKGLAGS